MHRLRNPRLLSSLSESYGNWKTLDQSATYAATHGGTTLNATSANAPTDASLRFLTRLNHSTLARNCWATSGTVETSLSNPPRHSSFPTTPSWGTRVAAPSPTPLFNWSHSRFFSTSHRCHWPRRGGGSSEEKPIEEKPSEERPSEERSSGGEALKLMDVPQIVPSIMVALVNAVRNKFFVHYIRYRYDPDFSIESFKRGAMEALLHVSSILAKDDLEPLKSQGLVEPEAFEEIRGRHALLSTDERRKLKVENEESVKSMVHRVGIIEDDVKGLKAVEITMVFAVMDPDSEELVRNAATTPGKTQIIFQCLTFANYRFYRDYSNLADPSDWTLNIVNHFKHVP